MEAVPLGRSGLRVAPLGIGAGAWAQAQWGYGATYGDEEIAGAYVAGINAGLNLFDTAEVYGDGDSERLLGALMRSRGGERIVVATKISPARHLYERRLTRPSFRNALAGSLRRLGLERIDLYQVHQPSHLPSIRSLMTWMAEAALDGQIRAVGVCNYNADQMRRAHAILAARGIALASNQVEYNVLHRAPEQNGVLSACRELGVTLVAHSPLARGLLSGKYGPRALPPGRHPLATRAHLQRLAAAEPFCRFLAEIGQQHGGKTVTQVALNWLLQQPGVVPIPGAKNAEQVQVNAGALGWALSAEEMSAIDRRIPRFD